MAPPVHNLEANAKIILIPTSTTPLEFKRREVQGTSEEYTRAYMSAHFRGDISLISPPIAFPSREASDAGQEDIPHLIGHLLPKRPDCAPLTQSPIARGTTYAGAQCLSTTSSDSLESVTICDPVISLNSGAHRIILSGSYQGESFTAIIEEVENRACGFAGEIIYVGMDVHASVEKEPLEFIKFLVRSSAGIEFYLDSGLRVNRRTGLKLVLLSQEEMKKEVDQWQCTLTSAADDCFLYPKRPIYTFDLAIIDRKGREICESSRCTFRGPGHF